MRPVQQRQADSDLGALPRLRVKLEASVIGVNPLLHADQPDALAFVRHIAADAIIENGKGYPFFQLVNF